jgi:hypothetical protein
MDAFVETEELRNAGVPSPRPLDETKWQAWLAKGRAQDQIDSAARTGALKWTAVAGLLAAAGFWPHAGSVEIGIRFLVTVGAMVVMSQAFRARSYAVAALFGVIALLYNPVAPVFQFSGDWQRGVVVASAILFGASLAWPTGTLARKKLHA